LKAKCIKDGSVYTDFSRDVEQAVVSAQYIVSDGRQTDISIRQSFSSSVELFATKNFSHTIIIVESINHLTSIQAESISSSTYLSL
jgi:hypothetical protein